MSIYRTILFDSLVPPDIQYNGREEIKGRKNKDVLLLDEILSDGVGELDDKRTEAEDIFENILPIVSLALNKLHDLDNTQSYWRIVIGPWLRYFVYVMSYRYHVLSKLVQQNEQATYIIKEPFLYKPTMSTYDFQKYAFSNKLFNMHICSDILSCLREPNKLLYGSCDLYKLLNMTSVNDSRGIKRNVRLLGTTITLLLSKLRKNCTFMFFPYLTYKVQIKLFLSSFFRLVPIFYIKYTDQNSKLNLEAREEMSGLLYDDTVNKLQTIIIKLVPYYIPKSFIENFSNIRNEMLSFYGSHVESLMSATMLQIDDRVQIYAAEMKKLSKKIVIYQHGGGYGSRQLKPAGYPPLTTSN